MNDLRWNVECPKTWTRIRTVEMHTGGEPLRVISAGLPPVHGAGVLEAVERVTYESNPAIIPEVSGSAFITGENQFWFDPDDPLRAGFILR
jgi:proline racemase